MTRTNARDKEEMTFDELVGKMSYIPGRVLVQELRNCARCGGTHNLISFKAAQRTDGSWTHWTLCPTTGDPILLLWKKKEADPQHDMTPPTEPEHYEQQ